MSDDQDRQEYEQYVQYLQHVQGTGQQAPQGGRVYSVQPGPWKEGAEGAAQKMQDPERWKQIAGTNTFQGHGDVPRVEGEAPLAIPAASAPAALTKLAALLNDTRKARVGVGAAQGAIADKDDRLRGAAIGTGTALVGEGLASALGKAGDVGMQMAVGRKKYTPGVGTILADEGLLGTKGMMRDQVAAKKLERWQQMSDAAKEIPGTPIKSGDIGQEIAQEAKGPMTGDGTITPAQADLPKVAAADQFANDVSGRGDISASEALARRGAAGQRAYRGKEDPLQSLLGKMSKAEQAKYSSALKEADQTGRIADADKAYAALARADAGLKAEASMPDSLFKLFSTTASKVPGGSALTSALGQATTKGSRGIDILNSPAAKELFIEELKRASNGSDQGRP